MLPNIHPHGSKSYHAPNSSLAISILPPAKVLLSAIIANHVGVLLWPWLLLTRRDYCQTEQ